MFLVCHNLPKYLGWQNGAEQIKIKNLFRNCGGIRATMGEMKLETARTNLKQALAKIKADQTTVAICLNILESAVEAATVEAVAKLIKQR